MTAINLSSVLIDPRKSAPIRSQHTGVVTNYTRKRWIRRAGLFASAALIAGAWMLKAVL